MKIIKTFYNGNKPFVIVATAFILLGAIFNDKLVNLSDQAAQVFSLTPTNTTPVVLPTSITPPSIYQYPALSKSGFYLKNEVSTSDREKLKESLYDLQSSIEIIARDIKTLVVEHKAANCTAITSSALCTEKLNAISNAMYTYAIYSVAHNKVWREYYNRTPAVKANTDWAGLAASTLYSSIKTPSFYTDVEGFLNYLSTMISSEMSKSALSSVAPTYITRTAPEMNSAINTVLRYRYATFSQSTIVRKNPYFLSASTLASVTSSVNTAGTWTARDTARNWTSITSSSDGTKLAAVVTGGYIYTSTDSGTTWTQRGLAKNWNSITSSADGTKLAATVFGGYIYTSTNSGATWAQRTSDATRIWRSITSSSDGTKLAAVDSTGYIYTSTNGGTTWTRQTNSGSRSWNSITSSSDGTKLAATAYPGYIYTSTDSGVTWVQRTSDTTRYWYSITSDASGTKLAAVVYGGYIYTSTDSGITWTQKTSNATRQWFSITSSSDGTKLAAAVTGGQIYTSTDSGVTWNVQSASPVKAWRSISLSSDGSKVVVGAYGAQIYTSNLYPSVPPVVVNPPVVVTPPTINPYLFVFGTNPLGYTDFKILNSSTAINPIDKFKKINGSVEELEITRTNLSSISIYAPEDSLLSAKISAALNYSFKYPENARKFNEIKLSILDFIFHNNKVVLAGEQELFSPSLAALEKKIQDYARNISSGKIITATAEVGIAAAPRPDGNILIVVRDGKLNSTSIPIVPLEAVLKRDKIMLKKLFIYHTHDNNTDDYNASGSGAGVDDIHSVAAYDASGNKVPTKGTIPSMSDLISNYSINNINDYKLEIVEKVIPGQGYGYEYMVPKDSIFVTKYTRKDPSNPYKILPTSEGYYYQGSLFRTIKLIITQNNHLKPTVDDVDLAMSTIVNQYMIPDGVIMKKFEIK